MHSNISSHYNTRSRQKYKLKIYKNISGETIKTHNYKNTNLKVMEIPLTAKSSMYETPGISITNSILFGLDTLTLKKIMHI